jgi:glycopeptide antibiotics resistance protein
LREFHGFPATWLAKDALVNVAAFVPLGWLLAGAMREYEISPRAQIGIVTGLCAALSLSVETVQLFIASRYSSIIDVASNTTGALVGALVQIRRRR